jgi:hypothetical protein
MRMNRRKLEPWPGSWRLPLFKVLDALHLAFVSSAGADYFFTCDDKLLRKAKSLEESGAKPVSPTEQAPRRHTNMK